MMRCREQRARYLGRRPRKRVVEVTTAAKMCVKRIMCAFIDTECHAHLTLQSGPALHDGCVHGYFIQPALFPLFTAENFPPTDSREESS
eukprot:359985-Chlamydomonas_euryale.AAC.13